MKFLCECGRTIRDQTDFLPYKAHFVADQDLFDLYDEIEAHVARLASRLLAGRGEGDAAKAEEGCIAALFASLEAHQRTMYQCPGCGRLFVDNHDHELHAFDPARRPDRRAAAPTDAPPRRDLLASVKRERWKRPLSGRWSPHEQRGDLSWQAGGGSRGGDEGHEEFTSWEALEARYHEVRSRLASEGTLRHAVLRKGDEVIHAWPTEGA